MPRYFRIGAIAALAATLIVVGIGFYRERASSEFRMKGFPTSLSQDVVATVVGYERREMDGDVPKYYIKADRATTFTDNHQELENVFLEVFDPASGNSDKITAGKAVYIPAENKNFTAYFAGDVKIDTRDAVSLRTEQVSYDRRTEIAGAEEQIQFSRDNITGSAFGATVNIAEKRLDLLHDVVIEMTGGDGGFSSLERAKITAGSATYDQAQEKIEFRDQIAAQVESRGEGNLRAADVQAGRAVAMLVVAAEQKRDISSLELFDAVRIDAKLADGKPTQITAGYALYQRAGDRFDLKHDVHIVTIENERPVDIRAQSAIYEQNAGKVQLSGGAEITQGNDFAKAESIVAELYATRNLRSVVLDTNGYLRQSAPERTSELSAANIRASFNESQQLTSATASGSASAALTPSKPAEYTRLTLSSPKSLDALFKGEGRLESIRTQGRTTIRMDAPAGAANAATKTVVADAVITKFNAAGSDVAHAEANGNAELTVDPLASASDRYRTRITAPRFVCEFFDTGNAARECVAGSVTKTVRTPLIAGRSVQTLVAERLNASFDPNTHDVDRLVASGSAKFTEADRTAIAANMTYTESDKTIRLRDGEPAAWDSRARARAAEIDWNTASEHSTLRGSVRTTYYSQKATGGSLPFGSTDKPVYVTSNAADFDHRRSTAVFTGAARAWQDHNFVRGDRLEVEQEGGRFRAAGDVQSLLYDAKRKENGRETTVPIFASAARMAYNRDGRLLHYEESVDIRQGADRITGGSANVYLSEKNEVLRTDIEHSVVITQPKRRALADFAQYTVADDSVVLRGNPARVEDSENGSSQAGTLTVYLKQDRVLSVGRTTRDPAGRTRSVYKVRGN
jgi:LPS export ABC transporter protein LptC